MYDIIVNMKRTIKIKITCNKELALETMSNAGEIFNIHAEDAFENKTWNKTKMHNLTYRKVRGLYPNMQSSVVQGIRDQASEALKGLKLKRLPRKKKYSAVRYNNRTFSILRDGSVSFCLVGGRAKSVVNIPEYFKDIWNNWKISGATLNYQFEKFWLHVSFQSKNPIPSDGNNVLGIDRGMLNIAVLSDGTFYSSKNIRATQRKVLYQKRSLQSKGTRNAKRKLKLLRGYEQRFQRDCNHSITKQIVAKSADIFALEDLKSIRVRSSRKGKHFNQRFNRWAFYQFEQFLVYKAEALGKLVKFVDPRYTSQNCSVCGHKGERKRSAFECGNCGNKQHADLNASINIKNRQLSSLGVTT
jgi:IS605 OrfB family transposase